MAKVLGGATFSDSVQYFVSVTDRLNFTEVGALEVGPEGQRAGTFLVRLLVPHR